MKHKISGIIIALELLLMVALPLAFFNREPGALSVAENRYLATFPQIRDASGRLSSTLLADLNTWFSDNIGFRDPLINLSSVISVNLFDRPAVDKVEMGEDGWLFLNDENNMEIVKGTYPGMTESDLAAYCGKLVAVQERIEAQGRTFVFAIPASKVSIYPEYIASGDYSVMTTPADLLADYLEEHSGIRVVRFKDAELAAKDADPSAAEGLLYYKTDTHWNPYGAYVGYEGLLGDFADWGLLDETAAQPAAATVYDAGLFGGDLSLMMGAVNRYGDKMTESNYKGIALNAPTAVWTLEGDRFTLQQNLAGGFLSLLYENEARAEAPGILIYGDSMVATGNLSYIAENFRETEFVWSYTISQDMIDAMDPDIVMLEISERDLGTYLNAACDGYLAQ